MTFAYPKILWVLPFALGGLWVFFFWAARKKAALLEDFASKTLLRDLLTFSPNKQLLKNICLMVSMLSLIVALARPQWGTRFVTREARGIDILFALDTSKSMLAEDYKPNRLERSKLAILDFLRELQGDRVGLIAFAGQSFLQCPLTIDYDAFRQSLEAIDTNIIPIPGTNIASAIEEALSTFTQAANYKLLILITDGEDLEGRGLKLADTAAQEKMTIYTVGVGTEIGELIPIRLPDGSTDFLKDKAGNFVKTKLDVQTLTQIADKTGGFFVDLGRYGNGLLEVYSSGLKSIPDQELSSQVQKETKDQYPWFIALSALFLMEFLLSTRKKTLLGFN